MFYPLIVLCLSLYGFLAYKNLRLAIQLLLFALPSYLIRFQVLDVPLTILEGLVLIAFAVWYIKTRQYKRIFKKSEPKRVSYPFAWEMVAVVAIALLAAGVSGFNDSALGIWKAYFFEPVLFFILIINNFKTRKDWYSLLWPLAVSVLTVSLVAIWQKISGDLIFNPFWAAADTRRAVSVFGYPNAVGLYLAPLILLISALFLQRLRFAKKGRRWLESGLLLSVIFAGLAAIVFARSRGALFGLVAGYALWLLLYDKITRNILAVCLVIITAITLINPAWRTAVVQQIKFPDKSAQIRLAQWQETWQMLSADKRWLSGSGLANYQNAIVPYHQPGIFIKTSDPDWLRKVLFNPQERQKAWQPLEIYLYPHNIILNFWTELGLAGLLLFIWIIAKFYVWGLQLQKRLIRLGSYSSHWLLLGFLGAMTASIVQGLMDVPYFKNDLALLFWLLIAGISALHYSYFKPKPLN